MQSSLLRKITRRRLIVSIGTTGLGLAATRILGQAPSEAAGSITTVHQHRYRDVKVPAKSFDLVQFINDFSEGAFLGWHHHDFPVFALILAGEATLMRDPGGSISYRVGSGVQCGPGVHTMGNRVAGTTMRRVVTLLDPPGVPTAVADTGPFKPAKGPKTPYPASRTSIAEAPAEFDFGQALLSLEPGATSAPYAPPGQSLWTIVEGEIAVESAGQSVDYKAGTFVQLKVGETVIVTNQGTVSAQVAMSMLLPIGAQVVTPVEAAPKAPISPPSTGDGGLR
jgi:quercetin dioxygenase-like cupin family protein